MAELPYLGNNIFCIEGDWEEDLRKKTSILSGLEMLSSISQMDFIYKTCASENELLSRLNNYINSAHKPRSKYKSYDIVYLATHGEKGSLKFNKLVDVLDFFVHNDNFKQGAFKDKIVHFGSCLTMKMKETDLADLKSFTQAKIISGYTKSIDFLDSTLFDVLYFNACGKYKIKHSLHDHLNKQYGGFSKDLGFLMV